MHEKDVVGIVTFDWICLLLRNNIIFIIMTYLFLRKLLISFIFIFYFFQQTSDYMQYPNTLNGYNLANSNYQFTS